MWVILLCSTNREKNLRHRQDWNSEPHDHHFRTLTTWPSPPQVIFHVLNKRRKGEVSGNIEVFILPGLSNASAVLRHCIICTTTRQRIIRNNWRCKEEKGDLQVFAADYSGQSCGDCVSDYKTSSVEL